MPNSPKDKYTAEVRSRVGFLIKLPRGDGWVPDGGSGLTEGAEGAAAPGAEIEKLAAS